MASKNLYKVIPSLPKSLYTSYISIFVDKRKVMVVYCLYEKERILKLIKEHGLTAVVSYHVPEVIGDDRYVREDEYLEFVRKAQAKMESGL